MDLICMIYSPIIVSIFHGFFCFFISFFIIKFNDSKGYVQQERKFQCKLMEHIKLRKELKTHFTVFIKRPKIQSMILNKISEECI